MVESLKTRIVIVLSVLFLSIIWVAPNMVNLEDKWWFTKDKLVYGLDIQGGLHLVMGVDVDEVIAENTKRLSSTLQESLNQDKSKVKAAEVVNANTGEIKLVLLNSQAKEEVVKYVEENYAGNLQILESNDIHVTVRFFDIALRQRKERVIGQAIETLRNRIDEFGVAEPSITAQGDKRILVQLPGIKDAAKAKELINKTARLDFMMVHDDYDPTQLMEWIAGIEKEKGYKIGEVPYSEYIKKINADLKDKLPKDTVVYFEKNSKARTIEAGSLPYLLRTDTGLGGSDLKDAFVTNDEFGSWQVAIHFNPQGGKKFADLTEKNIGKQMAVVLDKVIKSAPSIRGKIPGGRGVIEMGSGGSQDVLDEAKLISTALRAGSLPATLQQLEERTVGPSLGADSIARGKKAGMIGAVLVLIFMIVYYRSFGVVADLALSFNILILLAILSSLGATLTLPGVAGIVLTIGMAVDANVIIFERIKEELRKGASIKLAIKEGYARAFTAIFDANITTATVCFVLMYFGTGPVRGFAVTLLIGVISSMFTAIFVTRTIFEIMMKNNSLKSLEVKNV